MTALEAYGIAASSSAALAATGRTIDAASNAGVATTTASASNRRPPAVTQEPAPFGAIWVTGEPTWIRSGPIASTSASVIRDRPPHTVVKIGVRAACLAVRSDSSDRSVARAPPFSEALAPRIRDP